MSFAAKSMGVGISLLIEISQTWKVKYYLFSLICRGGKKGWCKSKKETIIRQKEAYKGEEDIRKSKGMDMIRTCYVHV